MQRSSVRRELGSSRYSWNVSIAEERMRLKKLTLTKLSPRRWINNSLPYIYYNFFVVAER